MRNTAASAPRPPAPSTAPARAAFATLDRGQQRLLEAVLFEARSCTEIAQAIGAPASAIRGRVSTALRELDAVRIAPDDERDRGGAVAAMLALRALEALDPDEAELVDVMLAHQPALLRAYADDCERVGELCAMVARVAPSPSVLARLCRSIDDDAAN